MLSIVAGCGGGTVGSNPPVKALVGTVVDQNETPVADAEVIISAPNFETKTVKTDAEGDFAAETSFAPNTSEAEIRVIAAGTTSTSVRVAVSAPGANLVSVILQFNNVTSELSVKDTQFSSNESSGKKDDSGVAKDPLDNNSGDSTSGDSTSGNSQSDDKNQDSKDRKPPTAEEPPNNPTAGETPAPTPPPQQSVVEDYQTMSAVVGSKSTDGEVLPLTGSVEVTMPDGQSYIFNSAGHYQSIDVPQREPGDYARFITVVVKYLNEEGKELLVQEFSFPRMATYAAWAQYAASTVFRAGFVVLFDKDGIPVDINLRFIADIPRDRPPSEEPSGDSTSGPSLSPNDPQDVTPIDDAGQRRPDTELGEEKKSETIPEEKIDNSQTR